MTNIFGERADWPTTPRIKSKLVHATSPPANAFESIRPLIALCNLSPYNPYLITDFLNLGPPPAREHRQPTPPPTRARCNFTPYAQPAMPNIEGHHGVATWSQKPNYRTYKSPYGPNAMTAGSFGVVGAVFALQFFADVPKVRTDIMQKLPVVGDYFIREIPPSDN
ncbi:MAG: hypothetical protein Q9197_006995, partial [Variospora fuerteventurae]